MILSVKEASYGRQGGKFENMFTFNYVSYVIVEDWNLVLYGIL